MKVDRTPKSGHSNVLYWLKSPRTFKVGVDRHLQPAEPRSQWAVRCYIVLYCIVGLLGI